MRFQTPQFIEIEDKVFGPLSIRQFIYVAGGGGISFIIFKALPLFLAVFFILPILGLSFALAFYKVNNRDFIEIIEAFFHYSLSDKLYLWRKKPPRAKKGAEEEKPAVSTSIFVPRLSESKLKDIAWSLDVQDSIYASQNRNRQ